MERHDYAFPFRVDPASHQAAQTGYEAHVEQMVRQVLLTSPGERIDLPEFGCGLRRLVFAPNSDALAATTQLLVLQALDRWLAMHIEVRKVEVSAAPDGAEGSGVLVRVEYMLRETRTTTTTTVGVS